MYRKIKGPKKKENNIDKEQRGYIVSKSNTCFKLTNDLDSVVLALAQTNSSRYINISTIYDEVFFFKYANTIPWERKPFEQMFLKQVDNYGGKEAC